MHLVNNFFMNLYVLLVDFQIHVGNGISGLLIGVDVGIKGLFQHMTHGFRHLSNSVFNIWPVLIHVLDADGVSGNMRRVISHPFQI